MKNALNGIGGIVGSNHNATINSCYNQGIINSNALSAGGILGASENNKAGWNVKIEKCYNSGNITKATAQGSAIGGISGFGYYIQIQDCYNKGNIQGTNLVVGEF